MDSTCDQDFEDSHILIVDDEAAIREILHEAMTDTGFNCSTAENGIEALAALEQTPADVVLTDVDMPGMSGVDLTRIITAKYTTSVIVMTGHIGKFSYDQIIDIGASDFITKPATPKEIILRIKRVLRERCLFEETIAAHKELEAAHDALKESYLDTIQRLVLAAEYKDEDTGDHIVRIGRYCELIAEKLGMEEELVKNMRYASPMHDIGKIGIPDIILLKQGKLSDDEFEIIKTHTTIGAKILAKSKSEILRTAQVIAVSHHERWDGGGYPQGFAGDKIPLPGRIVTIADTFDALVSKRPYKPSYPLEYVIETMKQERGKHFEPDILDVFLNAMDDVLKIRDEIDQKEFIDPAEMILSERDRQDAQ